MRDGRQAAIVISDLRGGRNGTDAPLALPANQVVEAVNIDWKETTFAHKRSGSDSPTFSGGAAFTNGIQTLIRHVPGSDDGAAELWGFDGAATPLVKRMTGAGVFANITLADAIASRPQDVNGASLNGKLFLAYDSSADRLHAYDPAVSKIRRVGIAPGSNAPTVANTGAGAYAATLRYYRVRWEQISGSTVVRRSEATPSVSFTPSGAGTAARITRPTAPGEDETHWAIEASTDNAIWYTLYGTGGVGSSIAIATTTQDDTAVVSTYSTYPLAPQSGQYGLFPSVKYLVADGNRLIGGGAWESSGATSGGKGSRLWFTPVLGTTDRGDDERVPNTTTQKNWVDLNEHDGGGITGLGAPLNGIPYAYKYRQVWKVRPTGDVLAPYIPRKMRDDIGCVAHKTICIGDDHLGRPAQYFLSHRGPYRITVDGDVQYLGRDNEDIWRTMNLSATSVVGHAIYYPALHQLWLWIATGSSNDPDTRMVFDVQLGLPDGAGQIRGGWAKHTGNAAAARCSTLFSNTLGTPQSSDLKPYFGRASGTAIWKGDTSALDDAGTAYQAYVTTRPLNTTSDLLNKVGTDEPILAAKQNDIASIAVTLVRDYGLESKTKSVAIADSTATRVVRKVTGSQLGEANVVQVTIGDSSAIANTWTLDAFVIPLLRQEPR